MIDFSLSEDLRLLAKTAEDFARGELRPALRDVEGDPGGATYQKLAARYAELGLGLVDVPESAGGVGMGLVGATTIEEALAFGDPGIALAMPSPLPYVRAVLALGNAQQHAALIPRLVESGKRGAIAWSEPRPKARGFATTADALPSGKWRIRGVKSEVVLGHLAGGLIVFAEARQGTSARRTAAFAVDADTPGVKFGAPIEGLGLGAAPTVEVTFEDVEVGDDRRLLCAGDRFDAAVVEMLLEVGLVGAAREVGLARASLELAREWAQDRKAFGKPIAHFQGLAFIVADMATTLEVMRALVQRAAWAADNRADDAAKLAAMAIAECHEGAMFVANNAVQVLGGSGFMRDYPAEKWMRDAKAHMAYALSHAGCDLFVGRAALEGGPPSLLEDAPLPEIQPVLL